MLYWPWEEGKGGRREREKEVEKNTGGEVDEGKVRKSQSGGAGEKM